MGSIIMTILHSIIRDKKIELKAVKKLMSLSELKNKFAILPQSSNFLRKTKHLQLIAEIKPKSPSNGVIRKKINPLAISREFKKKGASAISVLTEHKYFGGKLEYLHSVSQTSSLPILRKDFIFDIYQLYESKVSGASLVLLIASVLKRQLPLFVKLALALNLQPLIEVHNSAELALVLKLIAPSEKIIIGINNRDLKTFKVDLNTSLELIKLIPKKFIRISESGVFEFGELTQLSKAGFDGVLIGEGLVKNPKLFTYF